MKKAKKRMLGIFMTFCMLLSLMPATAYAQAAPKGVWVDGKYIEASGEYPLEDGGSVSYDASKRKLTLKNAKIKYTVEENSEPAAILSNDSLNIVLEGENSITVDIKDLKDIAGGILVGDGLFLGDFKQQDKTETGKLKVNVTGAENGGAVAIFAKAVYVMGYEVAVAATAKNAYGIVADGLFIHDSAVTAEGTTAAVLAEEIGEMVARVVENGKETKAYVLKEDGMITFSAENAEDAVPAKKVILGTSPLLIRKTADVTEAEPGDWVMFTIEVEYMGYVSGGQSPAQYLAKAPADEEDDNNNGRPVEMILIKDTLDDQFEKGYFCDAEGNPVEEILDMEVNDVILVLNKDIDTYEEDWGNPDAPAELYPGETATLYYKAQISEDAESGDAVNIVEVKGMESLPIQQSLSNEEDDEAQNDPVTFASVFEAYEKLCEDYGGVCFSATATATVAVEAEEPERESGSSNFPDVEIIGDGGSARVGKKIVIIEPDEGYGIGVVTVNGKEVEVPADGRLTGLRGRDEVVIRFAKLEPVQEEVKEIVLTIGSKVAWVFDAYLTNDVSPVIRNGRTMLPARFVAEALGAEVTWNEADQKVTITKDGTSLELFIGEPFAVANGEPAELDSPAFIENDRTYLPLRLIAEYLGAEVDWNEADQTVTITAK